MTTTNKCKCSRCGVAYPRNLMWNVAGSFYDWPCAQVQVEIENIKQKRRNVTGRVL